MPDVVELTKALIAAESITPARGAVFDVLEAALVPLGFAVERFVEGDAPDGPVENLLATRGDAGSHFAFAGHLDVVPPGDGWESDAFEPEIRGELHGLPQDECRSDQIEERLLLLDAVHHVAPDVLVRVQPRLLGQEADLDPAAVGEDLGRHHLRHRSFSCNRKRAGYC